MTKIWRLMMAGRKGLRFPNGIPRTTDIVGEKMSDKPPLPNIDLRTRIAAVLEEHRQVSSSCECGFDLGVSAITWHWRDHVADAVIAALGLRRESKPNDCDHRNYPSGHRYITEWIDNG